MSGITANSRSFPKRMLKTSMAMAVAIATLLASCMPGGAWAYYDENEVDAGSTIITVAMLTHTVTYDANASSGTTYTYTARDGETITAPNLDWTKGGLTFSGWNTSADGTGEIIGLDEQIVVYSDVTLYAQFSAPVADMPASGLETGRGGTVWALLVCACLAAFAGLRSDGDDGVRGQPWAGSGAEAGGYRNTLASMNVAEKNPGNRFGNGEKSQAKKAASAAMAPGIFEGLESTQGSPAEGGNGGSYGK